MLYVLTLVFKLKFRNKNVSSTDNGFITENVGLWHNGKPTEAFLIAWEIRDKTEFLLEPIKGCMD